MSFLLLLAVAPGAYIVYKVYKQDKIEKESRSLIKKLLIAGAITVFPALIFEIIASVILDSFYESAVISEGLYIFFDAFIGTALVEEGVKFFAMKKITWKNEEFDYTFDGIVYAVCVSMGFAIIENICYVFENGVGNALIRAVTAVPGHAVYGIYMGYYFGCAKLCEAYGESKNLKSFLKKSLWIPVLLHGFYDYCLMSDSDFLILAFLIFIIVLFALTLKNIKKFSMRDTSIYDEYTDVSYEESEEV
ncbi:MAG: PrsW family intramembrane metalloprotease [Lachnospiraceae bacterium]|nr:PrsW family intramembrane metalloprotease [Lachnospiraceae bacterium]